MGVIKGISSVLEKVNYCWRLFATASVYAVFGVGCVFLPLLAFPPLYLFSRDQYTRQKKTRLLVHWTFRGYVHLLKLVRILDWEVQGMERLKRPGILVVSNHPTLLDVVFLIAFMPNADCIIKSDIQKNLIMSRIVLLLGYIKNDRGALLIEDAKKSLNYGNSLIIFAEGTRTKPDEEVFFLRGAANIIIRTKTAPIPVIINCFPNPLSKENKWYDIPNKRPKLTVRVLEEMELNRFLVLPPSIGARQLTNYMEDFFRKEIALNEY